MIKRLLSGAMLVMCTLGAFADEYPIGTLVYSSDACFRIAGDNLLSNSDFASGLTANWTSINETSLDEVFNVEEGAGPSGEKAIVAKGASSNGCYQAIPVETAGTYVLVLQMKGSSAGFTQASRNGTAPFEAGQNYINLIFNSDGSPAGTTDRVELPIGEGGSYGTDGWTTICLPLTVSGDEVQGYVIPEIAALAEGVQVTNVELHVATNVFDTRTAQNFKDYCQTIYDGYSWANDPVYEAEAGAPRVQISEFQTALSDLQSAIDANEGVEGKVASLQTALKAFLVENADEMLQYYVEGDGDDGSLSWQYWTGKFNKCQTEMTGGHANAYWNFNTDRWCHKGGAANTDLGVQWQTKASGNWDNIATATVRLEKGTYFFGFEGDGGRGTANKSDWQRSKAVKAAWFQYWFNGDTIAAQPLDPALRMRFIHGFTVESDTTVTFGIRCNNTEPTDPNNWKSVGTTGMFTSFYAPVLYKVYIPGKFTEDEKAYLRKAKKETTTLASLLETSDKDLKEDASRPWGKDEYQIGYNEVKGLYDTWMALSDEDIIAEFKDNDMTLADTVKTNAQNPINSYRNNWLNLNKPFTNLVDSIAFAKSFYEDATCELYPNRVAMNSAIEASQKVYNDIIGASTSEFVQADSLSLAEAAHNVIVAVDDFKAWLAGEAILDIDFENAPVQNDDETYTIAGAVGQMDFPTAFSTFAEGAGADATTNFAVGYWNGSETLTPGVLRVGKGTATAVIADDKLPVVATADTEIGSTVDLVNVSFDLWYGNFNGGLTTFSLVDTDGEEIVGGTYGWGTQVDPLGIASKIKCGGGGSVNNNQICVNAYKTHMDITLNYGSQTMTCAVSNGTNGSMTVTDVPMASPKALKTFSLSSNFGNSNRRSWFDNLKVTVVRGGVKVTSVPGAAAASGDVNGDGGITMADANAIVNYYLAEDKSTVTGFNADAADMNGDGDITMADANAVVNMFLGQE